MGSGSNASAAAFNLPVGYRPARTRLLTTSSNNGIGGCRLDIQATGDVIVTAFCGNTWLSLDGISFRVVGDQETSTSETRYP